jgi:hypothetical protein
LEKLLNGIENAEFEAENFKGLLKAKKKRQTSFPGSLQTAALKCAP